MMSTEWGVLDILELLISPLTKVILTIKSCLNILLKKFIMGLQHTRVFYAPDYSNSQDLLERIPDYRNTLYWNPHVKINGQNNVDLEIYTSDDTGLYQIEVNGITNKGHPIFLRSSIKVD